MSVVKSKRGTNDLDVITKSRDLAVYTIKITSNEKNFPKRYRWCITNEIVSSATSIHRNILKANEVYIKDDWAKSHVFKIIDSYGTEEDPNMGMGLGSQVTQLIQLAVLDDLDHYIKEVLKIKYYVRYMDDFILIHNDKDYLGYCKKEIISKLSNIHLNLNVKKTQLYPLKHGIKFLGFKFILTDTSKVIKIMLREKISAQRRKLRKLRGLVDKDILTKNDVNKSYESWKAGASYGNNYNTIKKMDQFYKTLWED